MSSEGPVVRRGPLLLVLVCGLLFVGLATAVGVRHGVPLPGDGAAHVWALGHRPPVGQALARGITGTGTGIWPYLIVLVAGLIAGRDAGERVKAVSCALAVLVAGQLVRTGLMELFVRARPNAADWATHASGFAFPSGHATTSALTAGLLCWAVTRHTRPDLARTTCVIAACWAAAVGLSRIYLGVHWASDVLGGWLLAATWLGLCWWWLGRWTALEPTGRGGTRPSGEVSVRDPEPGVSVRDPEPGVSLRSPESEVSAQNSDPGTAAPNPQPDAPAPDSASRTPDPSRTAAPPDPPPSPDPPQPPNPHPSPPRPSESPPSEPPTEDHAPQDPGRGG